MGSDDLHHKRKARQYARRKPRRDSQPRILIICEGITERNYFEELRHKLSLTNIEVARKPISAPINNVDFAIKSLRRDSDYDRVYCVFDRDSHENFDRALVKARMPKKISTIVSYPCFEFWLLLHFEMKTKPFPLCDAVIQRLKLKKHFPHYKKSMPNLFEQFEDRLGDAIKNAKENRKLMRQINVKNPSTEVDKLVVYIQELRVKIDSAT